jgi:hypothetical protein
VIDLLDKLEPRSLFFLLLAVVLVGGFLLAGLIGAVSGVRKARWEAFSRIHQVTPPPEAETLFTPRYNPTPGAPALPVRPKENDQ